MPICGKTISSWVRKALDVVKEYMSPSILSGAAVSAAFVSGVSLVSMLQADNYAIVSTPTRYYFSAYITTMYCRHDSVQCTVLSLSG